MGKPALGAGHLPTPHPICSMRTAAVHGRWSAGGSGPRGQVQRMRWMYGAVQILLRRKPCCMPGLPWGAKALPAAQRPWKADSCLEGASLQCRNISLT